MSAVQHYKDELVLAKKDVVFTQKRILSLYNDHNVALLKLQTAYVCAYCLVSFSITDANEPCSHNKSYKSEPAYKDVPMPVDIRGSKMHYWTPARKS